MIIMKTTHFEHLRDQETNLKESDLRRFCSKIDYTGTDPFSPCNKCLSPNVTPCICTIKFTLEQSF